MPYFKNYFLSEAGSMWSGVTTLYTIPKISKASNLARHCGGAAMLHPCTCGLKGKMISVKVYQLTTHYHNIHRTTFCEFVQHVLLVERILVFAVPPSPSPPPASRLTYFACLIVSWYLSSNWYSCIPYLHSGKCATEDSVESPPGLSESLLAFPQPYQLKVGVIP